MISPWPMIYACSFITVMILTLASIAHIRTWGLADYLDGVKLVFGIKLLQKLLKRVRM